MKAMILARVAGAEERPLTVSELPVPEPHSGEVLIAVSACGVCRTDLHVVEGELPLSKPGIIPGHQVVGRVVATGSDARLRKVGDRVGIAWLHRTCGRCEQCTRGRENLCPYALFTGYTAQGGYAEYVKAPEAFVYPIPEGFADLHAAPLLCAGIIGYRCLKKADVGRGDALGIYGFGAAGHVCIQVALHLGIRVFVCTRDERHRKLALELGAEWSGDTYDQPPELLHAGIVFAPAGEIVPAGLRTLQRGGKLVLGGIHMSKIPAFDYELLYHERSIQSVANNTREDGREFLRIAAEIPIKTQTEIFPLEEANEPLIRLKNDAVRGAAVLKIKD
jgi:propanol-preferring alcohol dehydrogenase